MFTLTIFFLSLFFLLVYAVLFSFIILACKTADQAHCLSPFDYGHLSVHGVNYARKTGKHFPRCEALHGAPCVGGK